MGRPYGKMTHLHFESVVSSVQFSKNLWVITCEVEGQQNSQPFQIWRTVMSLVMHVVGNCRLQCRLLWDVSLCMKFPKIEHVSQDLTQRGQEGHSFSFLLNLCVLHQVAGLLPPVSQCDVMGRWCYHVLKVSQRVKPICILWTVQCQLKRKKQREDRGLSSVPELFLHLQMRWFRCSLKEDWFSDPDKVNRLERGLWSGALFWR